MTLFKGNRRSEKKVVQLISNLEKIAKIAVLRLEKEDYASVREDLGWIEDNFIQLLKLREKNFPAFKMLIDPKNKYKRVKFESIDFSKIDFSNAKIVKLHESLTDSEKRYRKRYNSYRLSEEHETLNKYIDAVFSIYHKADEKRQFFIQKQCTYVFANWIGVLDRLEDENPEIDFSLIIQSFLSGLTNLNSSILQAKEEELHPLFRFLSFNIYLEKIFDDEFNFRNGDLYFRFLFQNIYVGIKLGRIEVFEEFIERCIDSTFYPSSGISAYSQLDELLVERQEGLGMPPTEISKLLDRITEFGFVTVTYLRSDDEYETWKADFQQYLGSIENGHQFAEVIGQKIKEIEQVAYKLLNFNKLQIVVIKGLTYSLFKGHDNAINHAFDFNQPHDSRAMFANREIVPVSLAEILNYLSFSFTIENDLIRYWEAHHGVEPYLERIFLIFFYRYNPHKRYYTENIDQVVDDFCKIALKNDSSSISALKSEIAGLEKILEYQNEHKTQFLQTHLSDERKVSKTAELFASILSACQRRLDEIETSSEIKATTVDKFLRGCVSQYEESNYLYKLFAKFSRVETDLADVAFVADPGINELIDRFAFIENWHVPYYGLSTSIGNSMAERENSLGFSALRRIIKSESDVAIKEWDIPQIVRQTNIENKIVIGRNIYFESIFRDEKDFVSADMADDPSLGKGFFIGEIGGIKVFNVYDNSFDSKMLLIISMEDILRVRSRPADGLNVIGSFGCRFIDFANNDEQTDQFLNKPPQWLTDQIPTREKQEEYIKTRVWVQISKGIKFEVAEANGGFLFGVE